MSSASDAPTPLENLYEILEVKERREEWDDLFVLYEELSSGGIEAAIAQALEECGVLTLKFYKEMFTLQREVDLPNAFWADLQNFLRTFTYKKTAKKSTAKKKSGDRIDESGAVRESNPERAPVAESSRNDTLVRGEERSRTESTSAFSLLRPSEKVMAEKYRAALSGGPEQPLWGRVLYQAVNYGEPIPWFALAAKCGVSEERVRRTLFYKYDADWVEVDDQGDKVLVRMLQVV